MVPRAPLNGTVLLHPSAQFGPLPCFNTSIYKLINLTQIYFTFIRLVFPNSLARVQQPRGEAQWNRQGAPLSARLDYPNYIFEKFLFCRTPSPFEKRSFKILSRAILLIKYYFSQTKQWSIICHLQYVSKKEIPLNISHWINDAALNLKQELSAKHVCHCTRK